MNEIQTMPRRLIEKASDEPWTAIRWAAALLMSLFGLYYAVFFPFQSTLYGAMHLMFALGLYALVKIEEKDSRAQQVIDGLFLIVIVITGVYFWLNFEPLQAMRAIVGYTMLDIAMSLVVVLAVTEYTRREYGSVLFGVIVVAVVYGLLGASFPGFLQHSGLSFEKILELSVLNFTGAFGRLTVIAALWIFIFMIWAGLLREFGEIDTFLDLAYLLSRRFESGVYQIAITGSMFVGAIVGSPAGNVVITGNFTIPMMKDRGILPARAAAIESVGSTGGMVLPPIMGSAAFIMATLLGIGYGDVIRYAALPAIILYALVMISVHFSVLHDKHNRSVEEITPTEREINRAEMAKSLVPIIVATVVLVYALAILRYSPTLAGIMTIGVYLGVKLVVALLFREFYPATFVENTIQGLVRGAVMMAPITIVLASMNTVVTILSSTGLPVKIAVRGEAITGGILIVILLMVAVVTIVFGMGMPISAAYLLAVALMEPLMVEAGVTDIVAHFFILYWAMTSAISPPVALGCAIAANIAEADFLETVYESVKVGLPYFILPFAFIGLENLIIYDGVNTILSAAVVIISITAILAGVQRVFESRVANFGSATLGLVLAVPTILINLL